MKNKITTVHESDVHWNLDGCTLQEAAQELQRLFELYGPEAKLDWYREDYSEGDYELRIISVREETDEEAKRREEKALAEFIRKQDAQKASDLAAYKQLQEKLGLK